MDVIGPADKAGHLRISRRRQFYGTYWRVGKIIDGVDFVLISHSELE